MAKLGNFEDSPTVTFLPDGRRVKTVASFAFVDGMALRWDVPAGAIVDGASIPRALWTILGGPFEGKYRDASVIHDWYCDLRSRPWRAVHLVFFEAMLASSVPVTQAKLLYAGVYFGGPRWTDTVVQNIQHGIRLNDVHLGRTSRGVSRGSTNVFPNRGGKEPAPLITEVSTLELSEYEVSSLRQLIDREKPDINSLGSLVENARMEFLAKNPDAEKIDYFKRCSS